MKTGSRIILIVCLVSLLLVGVLVGAGFYYYTHPSSVKAWVETSLSRAAGASVAVQSLSYGLQPLHVSASGITFTPGPEGGGFYLKVPRLLAEFSLGGSFGHKSLIVNRLEIKGISGRIYQDASVSGMARKPQPSSFAGALLKRIFAFLVFSDIQFGGAALTDGAMVVELKDQTLYVNDLQALLNADHRVEISCSARCEWPSRRMLFVAPRVQLKTDGAISLVNTQISCAVTLHDALFQSPFAELENLQGGTRLSYRPATGQVAFEDMNLTLQETDIKQDGWEDKIRLGLQARADGAFSLKNHQLTVRTLHLTMGHRLQFEGELDAALGTRKKIDLKVVNCRMMPLELVLLLPPRFRKGLDPMKLEGEIYLDGRIGAALEQAGWVLDADLETRLDRNRVSVKTGGIRMSGALTGSIRVRGQIPDLEVSAVMKAEHALLSGNGMDVAPFEATLSLSGRHPAFDLKDLSARIPHAGARFKGKLLETNDIHLKVEEGRVNATTKVVSLSRIHLNSSLLKNLTGSLRAEGGRLTLIEMQGKETGLIRSAVDLGILAPGWKLAGEDAVQVRIQFNTEERVAFTSRLAFQGLGFQDPAATFLGEKVSLTTTISGKADLSSHMLAADISLDADSGEVLYDRFYVDLKRHPLSWRSTGTYKIDGKAVTLSNVSLGLKDILLCRLNGRILGNSIAWQLDLTADIPGIPLKPLYGFFVAEPFQTEKPLLPSIQVGGWVSANVNLSGTRADWTAKGSLRWDDGSILAEDRGVSLKGIDLLLPLWLRSRDTDGPFRALKGGMSVQSVGLPFIPEQTLAFPLEAGPNRLSITSPTDLKIPGGDARIGPILITGLTGQSPFITTHLGMNTVDVGSFLAGIWPRPIQGTLSGTLDPIHIERGRLTSRGRITAKVFDGEVVFSDPGASGFLSGTPVFKVNVRWKDLNLSELTADTSFGKIEGALDGYAKGLEFAQGQVQKFDLLMETVRKDRVPQRISVRAVDNIARIGGGQTPFVGMAGMFASVFKEFPYEKIGVHATLENDVFRINGTIQEGGTEYLVKRGLLSGVNVVNQNPDNRVSFKDMIKRIKRIKTSKGGPVIR